MKIVKDRLIRDDDTAYAYISTPNQEKNRILKAKYLVMHYTAGGSAQESVEWLCDIRAVASAHLVIGRDGSITQLVDFNRVAWHAGISRWEGLNGLNFHSIGIELDNAGKLRKFGDHWRSWQGRNYPESEVHRAIHKHELVESGWHVFTEEQLRVALDVALVVMQEYKLLDVIGHDDIAPGRKVDPGPAFPIDSFRARLLGRQESQPVLLTTTAELNIRSGPGTNNAPVPGSPLPLGTQVEQMRISGNWSFVSVQGVVNNVNDIEGWVYTPFLERK